MTLTIVPQTEDPGNGLATCIEAARSYASASKARGTILGYESDWRIFVAFCSAIGYPPLPAEPAVVAVYASHLAKSKKLATIRRHVASIAYAHRNARLTSPTIDPTVQEVMAGIARTLGAAQRRKDALSDDLLRDVLLALPDSGLKALRDRAILLLGFAIAGRRSEIAALDVDDLRFDKRGVTVTIRRSKTDQEGQGREIGVPFVPNRGLCAVVAVREWLEAAGITEGPIFRSFSLQGSLTERRIGGRDVARLVQSATKAAGLKGDFAGHSIRAGYITAAVQHGARESDIQQTSGHKSADMLRRYVRHADPFTGSPLSTIFG